MLGGDLDRGRVSRGAGLRCLAHAAPAASERNRVGRPHLRRSGRVQPLASFTGRLVRGLGPASSGTLRHRVASTPRSSRGTGHATEGIHWLQLPDAGRHSPCSRRRRPARGNPSPSVAAAREERALEGPARSPRSRSRGERSSGSPTDETRGNRDGSSRVEAGGIRGCGPGCRCSSSRRGSSSGNPTGAASRDRGGRDVVEAGQSRAPRRLATTRHDCVVFRGGALGHRERAGSDPLGLTLFLPPPFASALDRG